MIALTVGKTGFKNTLSDKYPLVIWGASGHAMVVADIVRCQGLFEIAGFLDNVNPERQGTAFCGSQILGGEEQLIRLREQGINHLLFGFGNCTVRLDLTDLLEEKGFVLPVAIHPRASVAEDVELGAGTVIAAGAVVNSGVKIGRSVIVNTLASVDHECVIEDAAHIGPGANLAGRVYVGKAVQIGIGATIIDRVQVGAYSIIGAGAVVIKNIPPKVVAYGVPAKVKRAIDNE